MVVQPRYFLLHFIEAWGSYRRCKMRRTDDNDDDSFYGASQHRQPCIRIRRYSYKSDGSSKCSCNSEPRGFDAIQPKRELPDEPPMYRPFKPRKKAVQQKPVKSIPDSHNDCTKCARLPRGFPHVTPNTRPSDDPPMKTPFNSRPPNQNTTSESNKRNTCPRLPPVQLIRQTSENFSRRRGIQGDLDLDVQKIPAEPSQLCNNTVVITMKQLIRVRVRTRKREVKNGVQSYHTTYN